MLFYEGAQVGRANAKDDARLDSHSGPVPRRTVEKGALPHETPGLDDYHVALSGGIAVFHQPDLPLQDEVRLPRGFTFGEQHFTR